MTEEFRCIFELDENKQICDDLEEDINKSQKIMDLISNHLKFLEDNEKQFQKKTERFLNDSKNYLTSEKYINDEVKKSFDLIADYINQSISFKNGKINCCLEKISALIETNKNILDSNLKKIKEEKNDIKKQNSDVCTHLIKLFESTTDSEYYCVENIRNYNNMIISYISELKDFSIFLQATISLSLSHLTEYMFNNNEELHEVESSFKSNFFPLKENFENYISDFMSGESNEFSSLDNSQLIPTFKVDYYMEGYLIKRTHTVPRVSYATYDLSSLQFVYRTWDSSEVRRKKKIIMRYCQGCIHEESDRRMYELIIVSTDKKSYSFFTVNETNLKLWIKKLGGSFVNKSDMSISGSTELNFNFICLLISIIEKAAPDVHLSKLPKEKKKKLFSEIKLGKLIDVTKCTPVEACCSLKFYLEISEPIIPDEVFSQYLAVNGDVNVETLKIFLQSCTFENSRILNVLFNHFGRMVDPKNILHITTESLAYFYSPILIRPDITATDIKTNITKIYNLFSDLLKYKEELFPDIQIRSTSPVTNSLSSQGKKASFKINSKENQSRFYGI